jgi:hypothetical protein
MYSPCTRLILTSLSLPHTQDCERHADRSESVTLHRRTSNHAEITNRTTANEPRKRSSPSCTLPSAFRVRSESNALRLHPSLAMPDSMSVGSGMSNIAMSNLRRRNTVIQTQSEASTALHAYIMPDNVDHDEASGHRHIHEVRITGSTP